MRELNRIVVHCAATKPSMDIGVKEIDRWHRDRGWDGCGYHFVIRRDGTLEYGRAVNMPGAHVKGHNMDSLGICLAGGMSETGGSEYNFEPIQMERLGQLIAALKLVFGEMAVLGHRDLDPKKDCPVFDVASLGY